MIHVQNTEQIEDKKQLPVNVKKMCKALEDMELSIQSQKKNLAKMEQDYNKFKKFASSFIEFSKKQLEKKPRKPSGFVLPVPISADLCDFLNIPQGSSMARTEVTKQLIKYVSVNNLANPDKKTHIIPNEPLTKLLGPSIDLSTLTRFTMQRYMNRHFVVSEIL